MLCLYELLGAKKIAKKRQKRHKQKSRGQKRRLKYQENCEFESSSSYTDCTDETVIKDYIENITTNLYDSDVDTTLRKGTRLIYL